MIGSQGACARVILVFRECIWNMPAVSLILPVFDVTGSLGSPPRQEVYPHGSMVPPWVTASRFLAGNSWAELKPTTFSSLLLFRVFFFSLFSQTPSDIIPLSAAYWDYSSIIIIIIIYY